MYFLILDFENMESFFLTPSIFISIYIYLHFFEKDTGKRPRIPDSKAP